MPSLMNVVAGGLVATAFVAPSSVLLVAAVDNVATLTVADLAVYPTARCLDGTGYGFYYREGAAEDTDKWMIMLEGGGLCTGVSVCARVCACVCVRVVVVCICVVVYALPR